MTRPDTPPARKGLLLTVYRPAGWPDATNGGITATAAKVTVTGIRLGDHEVQPLPRDMQVFAPTGDAPEVTLTVRTFGRSTWRHLEPVTPSPAGRTGYMDGGNYAATTDSRWTELTGDGHPVSVHDRTEG